MDLSTVGDNCDNYDETMMIANKATAFRSSTMRLALVAADIQCSRLWRTGMAKATVGAWNLVKPCVRYIYGHSRWIKKIRFKTKSVDLTDQGVT